MSTESTNHLTRRRHHRCNNRLGTGVRAYNQLSSLSVAEKSNRRENQRYHPRPRPASAPQRHIQQRRHPARNLQRT